MSCELRLHFFLKLNRTTALLKGQRRNLNRDLGIVRFNYPKVSEDAFTYHWMIVNTRSFYYEYPGDEKGVAREDRMALCPFVDYFNHSDEGVSILVDGNLSVVLNV